MTIELALRNILPLVDDSSNPPLLDTFFGIYDRVRSADGTMEFRLLEASSTHTTNLIMSLVSQSRLSRSEALTIP